jgi:NAD(P)-dependent dehydrogenase (short-subunit alcohol dehydrogenase family)
MTRYEIDGRVVLITGAARGIGRDVATAYCYETLATGTCRRSARK